MKLKINYKKKIRKITNMWRLNIMLLNNNWVNEEIKRNFKKPKDKRNGNMTYYVIQEKQF